MFKSPNPFPRWLNWSLLFPLFVLNVWLLVFVFQSLQPLVSLVGAAALFAFLLEYPVLGLQKRGIPRSYAVGGVFLLALSIVSILGITFAPFLLTQLQELANRLPTWIDSGIEQLQVLQNWASLRNLPVDLSGITAHLEDRVAEELQALPTQIVDFVLLTLDSALEVLVTVVLTFYFLLHGNRLWEGIFIWLPENMGDRARSALQQNFEGYFIGQATIATLMSLTLIPVFWLLQVPFGLLFGWGIGLMVLIPFGDILGIVLVSSLVALNSVWLGVKVLVVATVIDQLIDQAIAPRILGKLTGLNPIWVIIALLLGAKGVGVLGLLVAVPIAGSLKSMADGWRDRQEILEDGNLPQPKSPL